MEWRPPRQLMCLATTKDKGVAASEALVCTTTPATARLRTVKTTTPHTFPRPVSQFVSASTLISFVRNLLEIAHEETVMHEEFPVSLAMLAVSRRWHGSLWCVTATDRQRDAPPAQARQRPLIHWSLEVVLHRWLLLPPPDSCAA
mmetsp:Transcript_24512/g.64443  ORF Transcript_24512/g.64443 Transcript_24512/m.64443 type:complete len:145 (+) Transcript_24512:141-575(+)